MTDIIKEFNMIDVLGILLPGALLTALFGTEFGLWARISLYFGVTLTTGMVSAILIIAGFAFGCLLHELGDLVEKFLWSSKLLSPKTYEAIRSGYAAHFIDRNQALLEELEEKESENEPFTLRTVLALAFLIGGGLAALLGGWWFLGGLAAKNAENKQHMEAVIRKRDLFEGFKAMARNLMLALILLGVYGAYTGGILHDIRGDIFDAPAKVVISIAVMALLALRYYHYSYLKYKYSYEDLMRMELETAGKQTAVKCE